MIHTPMFGASLERRTTLTLNADHATLLAHNCAWSMVMYFVRTVWELMRLKRDTGPPARMQEEIFRVFAVFLDGLDMIVTGAESKDAHTRPGGPSWPSVGCGSPGTGSDMSSESWKLFALAVPVTCRNLKLAVILWSRGAFCSNERSPVSDTTAIDNC